jgi:hypothetical protein
MELRARRTVGGLEEPAEALLRLLSLRDGLFQPLRLHQNPGAQAPARFAGLLDFLEDRLQLAAELREPRDLVRGVGRGTVSVRQTSSRWAKDILVLRRILATVSREAREPIAGGKSWGRGARKWGAVPSSWGRVAQIGGKVP